MASIPDHLFQVIANYTYDWESWISPEGRPLWINPAVERMTGHAVADCLTMADYPLPLVHPEDRAALAAHLANAQQGASANDVAFRILHRDGQLRWGAMSWQTLYDHAGKALGVRTSVRDITRRKEAEAEQQRARAAAERANLAKSKFLAAASHDLRQPLQAAGLFLGALKRRDAAGASDELLVSLEQCLASMQELLDSLLDISRLDAQVIAVKKEDVAVSDLFDRLRREFAGAAAEKGLQLTFIESSLFLHSDPLLLHRVLQNFLANALRYTLRGRVVVGARRRGDLVRLEVWDSGIGIPATQHQLIFQEFVQLANQERDRSKGLGLGLAIVERIAQLLGCPIALRSWPGKGSVFSIAVPLALEAATSAAPPLPRQEAALTGLHIAVLDDVYDLARALQLFLEGEGARVTVAGDLSDLQVALHSAGRPDVVIADYRLRDSMDGAEAILRLRQTWRAPLPGLLLTGDTEPSRLALAQASGLTLLHKPVAPRLLIAALARLTSREAG